MPETAKGREDNWFEFYKSFRKVRPGTDAGPISALAGSLDMLASMRNDLAAAVDAYNRTSDEFSTDSRAFLSMLSSLPPDFGEWAGDERRGVYRAMLENVLAQKEMAREQRRLLESQTGNVLDVIGLAAAYLDGFEQYCSFIELALSDEIAETAAT